MNKVAIIIPYYGKWPTYLDLFLSSVHHNQEFVDVLLFTDLQLDKKNVPANIQLVDLSFEDLVNLFKTKTGIIPNFQGGFYKLCDLKPTYGLVFEDYIKDYKYWAFGDLDLVFGDLGILLGRLKTDAYDAIIGRRKWVSGCFSVFRNLTKLNRLFLESKDIQSVFENPDYVGFDEVSKCWDAVVACENITEVDFPFENFTFLLLNRFRDNFKVFHQDMYKESIPDAGYLKIKSGVVKDHLRNEYPIYHFITEKKKWTFKFPEWESIPNQYYITPFGFTRRNTYLSGSARKFYDLAFLTLRLPQFFHHLFLRARRKVFSE